jgi:hypothetical protein
MASANGVKIDLKVIKTSALTSKEELYRLIPCLGKYSLFPEPHAHYKVVEVFGV